MLPRADLNANRPPATVEPPTPATSSTDARQEVFRRLTQIAIGKELTATVLAKFEDGTHLVKVADAQARMALPVGTKVGDQLSMVFIAREPRPTFLLTGQPGSASASLSTAARLIDHLLQSGQRDGTGAVRGNVPLLTRPGSDAAQLASRLQQALSVSGLFYESHLEDWISGSRSQSALANEPQARFGAQSQAAQAPQNPADMARLAAGMKALGENAQALMQLVRDAQAQGDALRNLDAQVVARPQTALPVLDPELARLLQQQLNTLEQQQIRWQGQLWPGQEMEWDVTEERSHSEPDNREASSWTSVVRFELPHLGAVEATVRLVGERVHVQVNTGSDGAATSLRQYAGLLAAALQAAGSPLEAFQVARGENDGTA